MIDISELHWVSEPDCILLAILCASFSLYMLKNNAYNSLQNDKLNENNLPVTTLENEREKTKPSRCFRLMFCRILSNNDKEEKKTAVGVYLFLIGVIFAIIDLSTTKNENNQYDLPLHLFGAPVAVMALQGVNAKNWLNGLLEGAIPQIPLVSSTSISSTRL